MSIDFSSIRSFPLLKSQFRLLGNLPGQSLVLPSTLRPPTELLELSRESTTPVQTVSLFSGAETGEPSKPPIGPGTRVLIIGDSHTVGTYGSHLDDLVRETGATVETHGSSGSSPSWWFNETPTRSGYYKEDEHGKVRRSHWDRDPAKRERVATPQINTLLNRFKPDVVIVSLGANMINASESAITNTSDRLAETIKDSGAQLFWVGSPNGRFDRKPQEKLERLQHAIEQGVADDGRLIDSRDYTQYYGSDGLHYSGKKGTKMAKLWAQAVLDEIQYGKETALANFKLNFEREFNQKYEDVFR